MTSETSPGAGRKVPERVAIALEDWRPLRWVGRIQQMMDGVMVSDGPPCAVGDVLRVIGADSDEGLAMVVGLDGGRVRSMLLTADVRVTPDTRLRPTRLRRLTAPAGPGLFGRVVDAFGHPLDGKGPLGQVETVVLASTPPPALSRRPLTAPFYSGVTGIDALFPLAQGQRVGLFSGSGVGKSTLLAMMVRNTPSADRAVVCLVGERGREVADFVQDTLGEEGLTRAVVVVATSDQPAPARILAAEYATRIAEWFRAQGESVLLIMDSLTRYAMALREVGLAAGELPVARGYPPSVFAALPRLLERAGSDQRGAITAIYTVLVEGDDMQEPIADATRATLDGHIVLSRELAARGHYPAIDPMASISRLADHVAGVQTRQLTQRFLQLWAAYENHADLIRLGAYVPGSDSVLDEAVRLRPALESALRQNLWDPRCQDAEDIVRAAVGGGEAFDADS